MSHNKNHRQPNIVLLTIDCWRGDHLDLAPNSKAHTPNISNLAEQSHYFSNAYTCGGWTKIAMTSLFSSTYSSMHGFAQGKLSADRPNLAQELKAQGYKTAGFTTNLVCGKSGGFEQGFDDFFEPRPKIREGLKLNRRSKFQRLASNPITGPILSKLTPSITPFYPTTDAADLVSRALEWLEQEHDKPYFIWLHFMDLHWPYRSSKRVLDGKEYTQMWQDRQHWQQVKQTQGRYYPGHQRADRWQDLYAEETQALDDALGSLFDNLTSRSDWPNTALCLTSDHGEEFYEHGTWAHSWNQLNHEGTHVPLILKVPEQTKATVYDRAVSQLDIAPTLLGFADIEPPKTMLGQNLLSPQKNKTPIISEMHGHRDSHKYRLSIRYDGYHYVYDSDHDRCFLYESSEAEGVRTDIYDKHCLISKRFDKLRLQHITLGALDMLKDQVIIGEDEVSYNLDDDPAVIERLQALGYLE